MEDLINDPYVNDEVDTLFFNNKGLRTPYKETYEEIFGKPMTTNKANINLGSYVNGISKEEARNMKPDVYKDGKVIEGPSVSSNENEIAMEPEEKIIMPNTNSTMEDLFNKVNEGIVSDKVYKRLNVNVTSDGSLVTPEERDETLSSNEVKIEFDNEEKTEEQPIQNNINTEPVQNNNIQQNNIPEIKQEELAQRANEDYKVVKTAYDNGNQVNSNNISNMVGQEGAPGVIVGFSFFIPILGIILYFSKNKKGEIRYARNCLLAGLFGFVFWGIIAVLGLMYLDNIYK